MYDIELTESLFLPQTDGELRDITIGELLRETAEVFPDSVAMVDIALDGGPGQQWNYGEVLSISEKLAMALASRNGRAPADLRAGRPAPGQRRSPAIALRNTTRLSSACPGTWSMRLSARATMETLVNQAYDNMGFNSTQTLATLFDGSARHSPEGVAFKSRAEEAGFKQALAERDSGEPIPGSKKKWVTRSNSPNHIFRHHMPLHQFDPAPSTLLPKYPAYLPSNRSVH